MKEEKGLQSYCPAPYSSDSFAQTNTYGLDDAHRDYWSVGMILLEILVGSELVLATKSYLDVRLLMELV